MTGDVVRLARQGDVAIVTIDNPPVNATGQAVRAGLMRAAKAIADDPEIRGAVLVCAGRSFVAGADITEFGRPPVAPSLRDVCAAIETLAKPVVAVLHGAALGGGLELALSCHYRVIDPAGAVGLPEVTLGIIPGAGGTQRLPRLIGVAPALDLITTGRRVEAAEALRLGIADAVTSADRLAFAIAFLRDRLAAPPRRLSEQPFPSPEPADIAAARTAVAKRSPGQIAPVRAIDVVAGSAGLDVAAGLALEHTAFEQLRSSAQAEALRHIFFAERAIAKVPGLGAARPLDRIGVVGGGTMGAGIAAACLLAGFRVALVERDAEALRAGRDRLAELLAEAVKRGKLSPDQHSDILAARLVAAVEMTALAEADLIVEAVFESLEVKQDVFRALDRIGSGNAEGFIGNRILSAYRRAADQMVEDGASPYEVDAAFVDFGFPLGLYAMQDMAGLDIGWATRKRLAPTRDPAERYVAISDRICERGWLGRKTGRGFYLYDGKTVTPNPEVEGIVADERGAKGIRTRAFTTAEIQERILVAAVNEGAKILDAGVALRAGDIDVVMVNGYGFPRWRGGPLQAANAAGLSWIQARLAALQTGDPLWRVAPLIARLASEGGSF